VRGDQTHTQWFDQWDVRKLVYWDLFAGAHGHTYGCHAIWQFWDGKAKPCADPRHTWMEDLDLPGAAQVGYARRLMESRPFFTRVPDQGLLASKAGDGAAHVQATRDASGSYAMIYSGRGEPFTVNCAKLAGKELRAWWFDPRTGTAKDAGTVENDHAGRQFNPPTSGDENDWVLVLDDAAKGWGAPGAAGKK
jgi:hypothetical protein